MTKNTALLAQLAALVVVIVLIALVPGYFEIFTVMQLTLFASMAVLALSLAFIWGFGGILSFGQTAFFGLGAYAYAVAAINFQDSTPAIACAILVPALFAVALGYFTFYGRISDVYFGVITLTVTLILFNVANSTSGQEYHIGDAQLGGFNGMPAVPTFNAPFDPSTPLYPEQGWYVTAGALVAVYILLRVLLAGRFGRIVVAVKENETRASLLGYDPRLIKLVAFTIGGAIAGLAGALYVNWGAFISPNAFSLSLSAEIIIWVTVGGLGTLIGPVIGAVLIEYIVSSIGSQQVVNANLVLGAVLLFFVLLLRRGLVPSLQLVVVELWHRARRAPRPKAEPSAAATPAGSK
ncbi:ABC transporter permease subunit [Acidimangrovimonas sediminis]|uniref:ABC transporter permease subunit n=1 Tax=Acidimangrovimonas sediminis TaxID=2056283 RepID=UPI000C809B00|nr:branched-chain amino acid ABC transporter permease [Acidimangrovimonas sediminis]